MPEIDDVLQIQPQQPQQYQWIWLQKLPYRDSLHHHILCLLKIHLGHVCGHGHDYVHDYGYETHAHDGDLQFPDIATVRLISGHIKTSHNTIFS